MKNDIDIRPRIVFLGPLPPPYMGPSLATEIILNSGLKESFDLIHMDTTHHEDLSTLAAFSLSNVLSAIKHYYLLLTLLISKKPDIVYIPNCQTTIGYLRDSILILLSKLFGRKVVCHLRGGNFRNWYNNASVPMRWYVRLIHKLVDVQIVLGETLRPLFRGIVPENRIYVVPNGRDFDETDCVQNVTPTEGEKKRILFLSNFLEAKGILDVLRSLPIVIKEFKDVEYIFAGAWRDAAVKAEMMGMVNNNPEYPINIVGKVAGQKKLELLHSADIFVLPTYYPSEGHPWVIVEALAAGLPVISTDHAAISESVVDGVNGFIVEKHNPSDVADRIITLCRDSGLCRNMGAESRKLYEVEFTETKMVERLAKALNAALAN